MKFTATARSVQGSSASRRLRRAGRVPAVVYGGKDAAVSIELDHNEVFHALRKEEFHSSILTMELEGKSEKVLLRSTQYHPYKQLVLHVDFQRITADQLLSVKVPLHFLNAENSPAVKLSGASINHVVTEVEINCLPADLPQFIEVDLSSLLSGGSIHASAIKLPKGVTFANHGNEHDALIVSAVVVGGGASA